MTTLTPIGRLELVPVLDRVIRVVGPTGTVGYLEQVGPVYVVLAGAVYNTSVEIAQCRDLDHALDRLRAL